MSVATFLDTYGPKSLPNDSERKFARRRQRIITKIREVSSGTGCDIDCAIERIEVFRLEKKYSIHKLAEKINEVPN